MNGPVGERNLWVEVSDDTFSEPVQLTFLRAGDPVIAAAVDIDGEGQRPVYGLERGPEGALRVIPAHVCAIEESGSGMAWLVYGGDAGVVVTGPGGGPPDPASLRAGGDLDFDSYFIVARDDVDPPAPAWIDAAST